jgi:hypothetical protein
MEFKLIFFEKIMDFIQMRSPLQSKIVHVSTSLMWFQSLGNLQPEASKASKQMSASLKQSDSMNREEPDDTECDSKNENVVATHDVERGPGSTIHTNLELLSLRDGNVCLDHMRQIVEDELHTLPRGTPDEVCMFNQ